MERAVPYTDAVAVIAAWKAHASQLQAERDQARGEALMAQLEACRLRDELRRIRGF